MSENISYKTLGEEHPAEFFRDIIEPLADSFNPADADRYVSIMSEWGLAPVPSADRVPAGVQRVYVLSRVTLGADAKVTSIVLDAMKVRFPDARILLITGRKSKELFEADPALEFVDAEYPRNAPVSERIAFGRDLGLLVRNKKSIVVDPDSRMTQLGLVEVCDPGRYFHFPSRSLGGLQPENLTTLTNRWLSETFGVEGKGSLTPVTKRIDMNHPAVAVSLGVGNNERKRLKGNFEADLIRRLGERYATIWLDRGAGGEEADRVTAAAARSGMADRIQFWEGSFAGFVSIIGQCDFYAGYDSAGQHAAAAMGVPLLTIFAGAPSKLFVSRWSPQGPGPRLILNADKISASQILASI